MNQTIAMMLGVSIFLLFCAVAALIWGIRTKQFDDYEKFLGGTKYDSEDALNDAYQMEVRKKSALNDDKNIEKNYRPPD